jgi:hypothetical protein
MKKPSVFVSSTCYDLKQVRADLKSFLESLGLDPVLSEYDDFPIDPGVSNLDNCLKAVEVKADIFLLIVGTRYGSLTDKGKTITNLEFLTARAKGIPLYVFVTRQILDVLPVWKANETADFSNVADSPRLFEFVANLRETGETWVFPFETAQDMFEALRTQLAYLFMDALDLRLRASKSGGLSPKLRQLSGPVLRLVIERPPGWEYLLLSEALQNGLNGLRDLKRDWTYGLPTGAGTRRSPSELLEWFMVKASDANRLIANIDNVINKVLPAALGPPGVSGEPEAIVYVADRIAVCYRDILEWKLEFQRCEVPDRVEKLKSLASCLCDNMVVEIEGFSQTLKTKLAEALAAVRSGQRAEVKITLKLTVPDLSGFKSELDRVGKLVRSGQLAWGQSSRF